jgi:hypothetical protein
MMTGKDNFEKKIKEKLEEVNSPYEESAWRNFASLLDVPKSPLWKRWYMPYLYSTILFVLAAFWYLKQDFSKSKINESQSENNFYIADTIYRKDTVWIVDTVYVLKKLLIDESELTLSNHTTHHVIDPSSLNSFPLPAGKNNYIASKDRIFKLKQKEYLEEGHFISPIQTSSNDQKASYSVDSLNSNTAFKEGYFNSPKASMGASNMKIGAPPLGSEHVYIMKLDKELVEGDTSNLRKNPLIRKNKAFIAIETGLSFLMPINRKIEYYQSFAQSINLGIEWENGFGLYGGIVRSQIKGEIDDDDLSTFSPLTLSSLPGLSRDIADVDEIYLTNKQLFFPLEFRWRSLYYTGFSFESSLGIVGNYLSQQEFQYEFENGLGLVDQFETIAPRKFKISHLKVGLGTNYLISKKWAIFLRSNYWFPTSSIGILENRTHGIEVNSGINYFIGN